MMNIFSDPSNTNASLNYVQTPPTWAYFSSSSVVPWLFLAFFSSFVAFCIRYGRGFLSILITSSALTLATLSLALPRPILSLRKEQTPHPKVETETSSVDKDEAAAPASEDQEITSAKHCGLKADEETQDNCDCFLSSPTNNSSSDSENSSVSQGSELIEGDQNQECSDEDDDGSISDESLIEIELPNGQYIDPKKYFEEEEIKLKPASAGAAKQQQQQVCSFQQKFFRADSCSLESLFQQRSLTELLAEINESMEEESFIEIDLSMGSIKCPRFEIEA